jgi:dipeptidyl aminopeptidase/acylaminoacyl peptidase
MTTFMVMSWTNGVPAKFARPVHYNVIRLPLPPLTTRLTMRHFVYAAILGFLSVQAAAQERMIAPPPSLTAEGIPPIPQSIAEGLARYAQFRQATMQAWHSTRRQVLIATALGNATQLHYLDAPAGFRRQITWYARGVHSEVSPSFDPADPRTFTFLYDPEGTEARSLYRYDMETGETVLVAASKTYYAPIWAKQGKWLAFDSAERNGKDRDLYVVQPRDPSTKRRVTEVVDLWAPEDWSPDGSTILVNEVFSNAETYLWRVNVETGEKTPINRRGDGSPARWYNARFSSDGRRVYAVSDRGATGRPRIWRCEVAACAWTPVTTDGLSVDISVGFEISGDGRTLATVLDRGAYTELHVIDLGTLRPRKLPDIGRGTVTRVRWRPNSNEVGFTFASVRAQGDVYSIDVPRGALTRWTFSEASFNAEVLPPPQVVEWKSFDGVSITGILYRPAAKFAGPRPVMVQIHGGPDALDRARWQGRSNYFLNEMGIALLYPNVRGSAGFGREFEQMDNGRGRDGAIKDIGAMLDWIAIRPDLDQNRVVLAGASYGGWLALEAGIHYNDRIRGIIEGAGMTDLVTYLEETLPARQENRRAEFGDERDPAMREYLKSISPVTRAKDLRKPTFILHPAKDTRVPVSQARDLLQALKANNATVWYAEFADANHDGFPNTLPNVNWMLAAWVQFMKMYVVN